VNLPAKIQQFAESTKNGDKKHIVSRKILDEICTIRFFSVLLYTQRAKMIKKDIQNRYLEGFGVLIILLALVRCAYDGISSSDFSSEEQIVQSFSGQSSLQSPPSLSSAFFLSAETHPHRIGSVSSYQAAFPDSNAVQLVAAQRWGVSPVRDRNDAENRKSELVFIAASPFYHVDPLHQSIPYLVPRAALLLQDIGRAFYDSLYVKGIPLHRFIVTSVLRTQEDVAKLRRFNGNATENSCHLYGTTFDICYNRYETVSDPDGVQRRAVRNDSLKWVLSEVLRDMRQQERCYIKYEVKQGCFHLTVR